MAVFLESRKQAMHELRKELVGPAPCGEEIACSTERGISLASTADFYRPWKQASTGQEIIRKDTPCKRYGVGVLYPVGTGAEAVQANGKEKSAEAGNGAGSISETAVQDLGAIQERKTGGAPADDGDDFDIASANAFLPSSMAISFMADFPEGSRLIVEAPDKVELDYLRYGELEGFAETNGRYSQVDVLAEGVSRKWWLRSSVTLRGEYEAGMLLIDQDGKAEGGKMETANTGPLDIRFEVYSRRVADSATKRLLTVCLVNRTDSSKSERQPDSAKCLFQTCFRARIESPNGDGGILPYPGPPTEKMDEEEQSLTLLYRNLETYAVGHGCAADWHCDKCGRVLWVGAEPLPVHETPSTTPDILDENGDRLEVSMAELAGLVEGRTGLDSLEAVVSGYGRWIEGKQREARLLPNDLQEAADRHLSECEMCCARMRKGLDLLMRADDPGSVQIAEAFRLANRAMYLQQRHASREPRLAAFSQSEQKIGFSRPFSESNGKGMWRAFQIAFFLMNLCAVADYKDPFRENVELIWFPTGGGKTEAYLGLTAFSMFLRRLRDPEDCGVNVIMRYTLRLLTSQQFQRACGLVCAMDFMRREAPDKLGTREFSIGLWLGGSQTPNKCADARKALSALIKDVRSPNPFVLRKCPWCGAQMGPVELAAGKGRNSKKAYALGYKEQGGTIDFACPDSRCHFFDGLPIYVIDEDIYAKRPDIVIGTVDKFAGLAWNSEMRSIFGISETGERKASPPGLIIQDELHLISGPLGSIVGLNEVLIQELCTDRRTNETIRPKIICSTATARRYQKQIGDLYGRSETTLFPPPGLDVADSFFSRYAADGQGELLPGKFHVGICAPGLGSAQTAQVRTNAVLLQAPLGMPIDQRDPWWTLLIFFNSLRELGGSISLMQSDIPDYFKVLWKRYDTPAESRRYLNSFKELTSRLRDDEIPRSIEELEVPYGSDNRHPIDCCLASNIIEVGVDIDRLSIMVVVGQPKSTSQYIQVTGRVGRRWQERPGLVVVIYSPSKPRDKSHYEKFKSYHQRLYAQVEPASVTPFSLPALERVLHAVMVGYVRQLGTEQENGAPSPFPKDRVNALRNVLQARIRSLSEREQDEVVRMFDLRIEQWRERSPLHWSESGNAGENVPLICSAGYYIPADWQGLTWPTMRSMRNVDAGCQAEITKAWLTRE